MLADLVTSLLVKTAKELLLDKPLSPEEEDRVVWPLPAPLLPVGTNLPLHP